MKQSTKQTKGSNISVKESQLMLAGIEGLSLQDKSTRGLRLVLNLQLTVTIPHKARVKKDGEHYIYDISRDEMKKFWKGIWTSIEKKCTGYFHEQLRTDARRLWSTQYLTGMDKKDDRSTEVSA